MKQTKLIMGMPIAIEIVNSKNNKVFEKAFEYFRLIDRRFSTYKKNSEVSRINRKEIFSKDYSKDMKSILRLAAKTKKESNGFFDIYNNGIFDPSGIVKGWSIQQVVEIILDMGYKNFYVNAGGDIHISGKNSKKGDWKVGIRNPFHRAGVVKVLSISKGAIATSGTYLRGEHIYNPHGTAPEGVVSISVICDNIIDADRYATAAFAMGRQGIYFIENLDKTEGYMIDEKGIATFTTGFKKFVL